MPKIEKANQNTYALIDEALVIADGKQRFSSVSITAPLLLGCQDASHGSSVERVLPIFYLYLVFSKDKCSSTNKKIIYVLC